MSDDWLTDEVDAQRSAALDRSPDGWLETLPPRVWVPCTRCALTDLLVRGDFDQDAGDEAICESCYAELDELCRDPEWGGPL